MSFERFVNYFTKQKKALKLSLTNLMMFYSDYIRMSQDLEIDLSRKSVRFPKDIKQAHDRVMPMFKEVENEIEDAKFKKATENLYRGLTEFADTNHAIVFPKSKTDFFREGQALSHCVGSGSHYYENHVKGEKMIFFVRRTSDIDTPFATLMIDMRKLTLSELMGYGNKPMPGEPRKFANKFLKLLSKNHKEGKRA
jgi:hypothetical protein